MPSMLFERRSQFDFAFLVRCMQKRFVFYFSPVYNELVFGDPGTQTQTQVAHTRQRSFENFHVHVFSVLIAYQLSENKPSLNFHELQQSNDFPVSL